MLIFLGDGVEISSTGHPLKIPNPKVAFVVRIDTFFNAEQSLKTELPIIDTEEGIEISVNEEQPLNAEFPTIITEEGIEIPVNEEQPLNALLPILFTEEEGIEILLNDEQPEKALKGIDSQSGRVISFREEQPLKHPLSRPTFLDKIVTFSSEVQSLKHLIFICPVDSGMTISFNDLQPLKA